MTTPKNDVPPAHLVWAAVAVVLGVVAGAVILSLAGRDITQLTGFVELVALPLLGVFGAVIYGRLNQVHTQTNGNLEAERQRNNELQNRVLDLAERFTPPTPPDPPEGPSTDV